MKRILFADNDPDFLRTRARFVEEAGYEVLAANTLRASERLLDEGEVQIAVLDLRLVNDRDEMDKSGLELAKRKEFRHIPKIILTKFPTYEDVREALGPALDGLPPAVKFVAKQEGPDALISAIDALFTAYVRLNLDLIVQPNERNLVTFHSLVALVDLGARGETHPAGAKSLENLFRRLFYEYIQVTLDQVRWQREGRVAVLADAFAQGRPTDSFVVVCGQKSDLLRESCSFRNFAPKAPRRNGTVLAKSSETAHFAANAYVLADAFSGEVRSLRELYLTGPEKVFHLALRDLFQNTLVEWHQQKTAPSEGKSLDELYRERLIHEKALTQAPFEERLQSLVRQLATVNATVEVGSQELSFTFGALSYCYADPTPVVGQSSHIGQPVLLMTSPGTLSGDNVLADENGRTWVTDFADAGLAPVLWNFVQMEAAIRFDWVESNRLQWFHEMEQCLVTADFSKLRIGEVEQPLRKPLRAIQTIRRLASGVIGNDLLPYQLGIFYHAIKRIAEFNPKFHLTPGELSRLGHALIASAMIAALIKNSQPHLGKESPEEEPGLKIDYANRRVWLNGRRLSLSRQNHELLSALYERPNQLFTRRELGMRIFGEKYDEADPSHINRLNQAIFRLREKIEDDPKHPRLLITEPAGGYRLVPQPMAT